MSANDARNDIIPKPILPQSVTFGSRTSRSIKQIRCSLSILVLPLPPFPMSLRTRVRLFFSLCDTRITLGAVRRRTQAFGHLPGKLLRVFHSPVRLSGRTDHIVGVTYELEFVDFPWSHIILSTHLRSVFNGFLKLTEQFFKTV